MPALWARIIPRLTAIVVISWLAIQIGGCAANGVSPKALPQQPCLDLPRPSEIVRQGSYIDAKRTVLGQSYSDIGSGSDDRVEPDGTAARFSPQWGSGGSHSISDAARAAFTFNIEDYSGTPSVDLFWTTPPEVANLWIGVANWSVDRWDWYRPALSGIGLPSLAPYTGTRGAMVAVVILGTAEAVLDKIRFGPEVWRIEVVDSPAIFSRVGQYNSLAVGSGVPHIAYYDEDLTCLKYAQFSAGYWHREILDNAGDVGRFCSIALEYHGFPHIAYYDATEGDLQMADCVGSDWFFQTLEDAGNIGAGCALAIDSTEEQHLAYWNGDTGRAMYVRYITGGSVTQELESMAEPAFSISLVLDASDNAYIAYPQFTDMRYNWFDGVSWHYESVINDNRLIAGPRSLALNASGEPVIPLVNSTNNTFWLASRKIGVWSFESITSETNIGTNSSFLFSSSGEPLITCFQDGLELLRKPGGVWQHIRIEYNGGTGRSTSLALDAEGRPCISYWNPSDHSLLYAHFVDTAF